MPELPQHSSEHTVTSGATPLVRPQPESQQPGCASRPPTAQFQPSATETATKDLQEGALPPAFAQTLVAGERGNASMTSATVVIDTGMLAVRFLVSFLIYSDEATRFQYFGKAPPRSKVLLTKADARERKTARTGPSSRLRSQSSRVLLRGSVSLPSPRPFSADSFASTKSLDFAL